MRKFKLLVGESLGYTVLNDTCQIPGMGLKPWVRPQDLHIVKTCKITTEADETMWKDEYTDCRQACRQDPPPGDKMHMVR